MLHIATADACCILVGLKVGSWLSFETWDSAWLGQKTARPRSSARMAIQSTSPAWLSQHDGFVLAHKPIALALALPYGLPLSRAVCNHPRTPLESGFALCRYSFSHSPSLLMPRLGSKKSRNGCRQCKTRRVKVNLQPPHIILR